MPSRGFHSGEKMPSNLKKVNIPQVSKRFKTWSATSTQTDDEVFTPSEMRSQTGKCGSLLILISRTALWHLRICCFSPTSGPNGARPHWVDFPRLLFSFIDGSKSHGPPGTGQAQKEKSLISSVRKDSVVIASLRWCWTRHFRAKVPVRSHLIWPLQWVLSSQNHWSGHLSKR